MAQTRVPQPLKTHGGKGPLAKRIVALMPPHMHYVEPFAGGLAVLLERDPDDRRLWAGTGGGDRGVSELVNDLNKSLSNFWRVVGSEEMFARFFRTVETIPLSRVEWEAAAAGLRRDDYGDDRVSWAVDFFVACRQSLAGRMTGFTPVTRNRTRRGMNGNVSEWLSAVDGLPAVHERLRRVLVEDIDALDLIPREDTPLTFYYIDPPYLHDTRASVGEYREQEMTKGQHEALLDLLATIKGKFILSGYPNDLYGGYARRHGWRLHTFDVANNAAGGKTKRRMTECCWTNYDPPPQRAAARGGPAPPGQRLA
jgi:DNA adenine methylase